jgi:hypothetical protein
MISGIAYHPVTAHLEELANLEEKAKVRRSQVWNISLVTPSKPAVSGFHS